MKYFFEVLIAPSFDAEALNVLKSKKNRILLQLKTFPGNNYLYKSILDGVLVQGTDSGNVNEWKEVGGKQTDATEKEDLLFANLVCKHLKSNAIPCP